MIYLLAGPDTYRSRKKLHEIIGAFREKAGDFDLHRIDASEDGPNLLRAAWEAQSLFQKKKLIVVERPTEGDEKFQRALGEAIKATKTQKDVSWVLWDETSKAKVESMLKSAKSEISKSQEFSLMAPAEERRWLLQFIESRRLNLSRAAIEELLGRFSGNTWKLATEAEKLALGGELASPLNQAEEKVFAFLDAVLLDAVSTARALLKLQLAGSNEHILFATLAGHLRTLLMVADGVADEKLHPFVLKKAREKVRLVPVASIECFYYKVFEADLKIKTGVLTPFEALADLVLLA